MKRSGGRNDAFSWSGLATDHKIVAAQIELFERQRHQRQVPLVHLASARKCIDESRNNFVLTDLDGDHLRYINVGENIRLRIHLAERLDDPLATAHSDQPIVNDCYSHQYLARSN